jgi:hypothetical protein
MKNSIGQSAEVRETGAIVQIAEQRYRAKCAQARAPGWIAHQRKHPITLIQQGYHAQRYIAAANDQQASHAAIMR